MRTWLTNKTAINNVSSIATWREKHNEWYILETKRKLAQWVHFTVPYTPLVFARARARAYVWYSMSHLELPGLSECICCLSQSKFYLTIDANHRYPSSNLLSIASPTEYKAWDTHGIKPSLENAEQPKQGLATYDLHSCKHDRKPPLHRDISLLEDGGRLFVRIWNKCHKREGHGAVVNDMYVHSSSLQPNTFVYKGEELRPHNRHSWPSRRTFGVLFLYSDTWACFFCCWEVSSTTKREREQGEIEWQAPFFLTTIKPTYQTRVVPFWY